MARSARRRRRPRRFRRLLILALLVGTAYVIWRPSLDELRGERQRLRAALSRAAAADPALRGAPAGDVVLGLRWEYTQALVEGAAACFLDGAPLHIDELKVEQQGEVRKRLLFSRVTVGRWRMKIAVHRLSGVVRAGRPRVKYQDRDHLTIVLPVTLDDGRVQAALRFGWDSRGVSNLVCRDFALSQKVEASLLAETSDLAGQLQLGTDDDVVVVSPRIAGRRLRVQVRPSSQTWNGARAALAAQDTFFKCGLALDPDDVMAKLREVLDRGLEVQLPSLEPRPVRVPIRFRRQLGAGSRAIDLGLGPGRLRVRPEAIWYEASVSSTPGLRPPLPQSGGAAPQVP